MSQGAGTVSTQDNVRVLLTGARFELMPFESFDDEISYLPEDATIAITTSPQLGIERTIERAEQAAAADFEVVPHVAARYVRDREHLRDIAGRLTEAGVTDIFVPGGDREEPRGEFESSLELLEALADSPYSFEDVGITGYPEGHDFLSKQILDESMTNKEPHATYIVTQLCYDPDAVITWIEEIRERGVALPVAVGIPGVMKYQRLLQISRKVGVGDSITFLRKTTGVLGFVRQLVGSRGKYEPDELIDGLAPYATDAEYDIEGLHIYTFNQTQDTEDWRRGRLGG